MQDAKNVFLNRISIHALREEGDYILIEVDGESLIISIHALREEGDQEER